MLRSMKHALFLLLTTPLFWQAALGGCPAGDLNRDCRIDFQDVQILGEQWLASTEEPADLDGNGKIALKDFALLAASWRNSGNPLSINEFMASNSNFVRDSQGQYDDWIEIHNQAAAPIDLAGFYLTDDLDAPAQWRFPTDKPALTTIPAGGFLLVWADGDVGDSGLHANFGLASGGDAIYLIEPDGATLIDSVEFREQVPNLSIGRYPDGTGEWRFMGMPTPAAPNVQMYQGFVAAPRLNHERGFYNEPFDVTLTCDTPGAALYYTLDGSEPYLTAGRVPTGTRYTAPIRINQSKVLRVKAVIPGWMPSPIATHTYIFVEQVIQQSNRPSGFPSSWGGTSADYMMDPDIVIPHAGTIIEDLKSLPTMSLVMNAHHLFSSEHGIYANPHSEGVSWEHPGSIEMIYPDGEEGFQSNCGVRIYGGVGRREKKKSFRLLFKGIYGATKLRCPLFGDDATDEFDTIILRANFNDGYPFGRNVSQYIRDEYCRRLQLALGHPSPHGTFVHLYINGLYWGLYNPTERPDASFAASYLGGEKEDYDAYNSGSPTGDSTSQSWNALRSAIRSGLETNEGYQQLQGNNPDGTANPAYTDYLDVESYIDFMLANIFVGNTDWPGHNWYGAMNRVNSSGFHFFMWDAEWVLWIQVGHGLDSDLYENRTNVGNSMCEAYARLRNNPEFRLQFADQVHRAFFNNGPMQVDFGRPAWDPDRPETNRCAALYAELAEIIERAMVAESARWGDVHGGSPRTVEQWRAERDRILDTYMAQRPGIVLDQLRNASLYPLVDAPAFKVNGSYQSGGHISTADRLSLTGGGTLWYTLDGTDPRIGATALPQNGDDTTVVLVPEDALKKVLVPTAPLDDAWKSDPRLDDSAWIASAGKPGGVGYERSTGYESFITANVRNLMYNVNPSCYIRIPFTVDQDLDESDQLTLQIRYDDGFIAYLNGVEVARRNFLGQPAWNSAASDQHSDGDAVNLENITLVGAKDALRPGTNILAIHGLNLSTTSSDFLISAALIAGSGGASGGGGSTSPSALRYAGIVTLSHSARVKTRALSAGQWSALSETVFAVGPVAESLRITEVMYHPPDTGSPDDPNTEYVELTNIGAETIDLNLVKFANGIDFTFPSFELAPGDYCLVVRDIAAFEDKYGGGFNIAGQYSGSLNNAGERIELQDAVGAVIHNFRFEDGWFDITDGLGFSLTVKDPATDPNGFDSKRAWRPSAYVGGSPGYDDTGAVPELGSVVINELLANSVADEPDWIELHNTTNQPIDVGGWFLSDDADLLTKYEIATGTVIPAGGYLVFDQDHHFGNRNDPGCHERFALSRDGETVYLHSGAQGDLTGYSEQERFDASDPGVSLGRYLKSTGTYNFVALSAATPGVANAAPQVGPVVITEIMYHPVDVADAEYVELLNISDAPVTLYDTIRDAPWRFTDDPDDPGIEFLFPADPPVTLAPGEYLVLAKDADFLAAAYAVPANVQVLAWGAGSLANGNEKIQLSKPDDEDDDDRHWLRIDRVVYSDGSHPDDFPSGTDPWPTNPDGHGASLTRIDPSAYGNDPANWMASMPSPGTPAR